MKTHNAATPVHARAVLRDGGPMITLQGYLAHKKTPTPLPTPYDPRHRLTVGS